MSLTLLGAELRKYEKRFQLTLSQRTLMLQVIALMVYLEAGAAAYAHVEQWKFVDAL
jgi:potassium channel subfamily K